MGIYLPRPLLTKERSNEINLLNYKEELTDSPPLLKSKNGIINRFMSY
jgi:hypothetical protein